MSCLIPRSDDKLPTSPKKGWKQLRRIFKSFKNSDDYYSDYYQYHVHYDDYMKQRRSSGATKSPPVEAPSVDHQAAAAAAGRGATSFGLTTARETVHVHRSKDDHRAGDRNGLGDDHENGERVDADCEEFIERCRDGWKLEKQKSADEFWAMLARST